MTLDQVRAQVVKAMGVYGTEASYAITSFEEALKIAGYKIVKEDTTPEEAYTDQRCYSCVNPATMFVRDIGMSHQMDIYVCDEHQRGAQVLKRVTPTF